MASLKEQLKINNWKHFKNDLLKLPNKIILGDIPDDPKCYFPYVVGPIPPTEDYNMHFENQFVPMYYVNEQYRILKRNLPSEAVKWLIFGYQFYSNEKNLYLDYFIFGINAALKDKKLNENEKISLKSCLKWLKKQKGLLEIEEKLQITSLESLPLENKILNSKIIELEKKIEVQALELESLPLENKKLNSKIIELEKKIEAQALELERNKKENLEFSKAKEAEILSLKNEISVKSLDYIKLEKKLEIKSPDYTRLKEENELLKNSIKHLNKNINEGELFSKITLLKNEKYDILKLFQYIDLLTIGMLDEEKYGKKKPKLGILKFKNIKTYAKNLSQIQDIGIDEATITSYINEARHFGKKFDEPISKEFIEQAYKHFGIENDISH